MAKEDFKDGAEPIDMSDYPYKAGDKLDNGITVIGVIRGDSEDSFGGYWVRPVEGHRGIKKLYGKPFILACVPFTDREGRNPLMDSDNYPDGVEELEMIGPAGDPYAQRVIYRFEGEQTSHYAIPEEFLKIAKKAKIKAPEPEPKIPHAGEEWTPGDDEFIAENYEMMSDGEMAKVLEVDANSLKRHRIDDLKLKKKPFGGG
jgi:hypothetical protein